MLDTDTETEAKAEAPKTIHKLESRFVKTRNQTEWTCTCEAWSAVGGTDKTIAADHKIHRNQPRNRGK